MSQDPDYSERRTRQRFVARRWGAVCFWVSIDGGERQALNDLSLEGFSYPLDTPPAQPQRFAFSLHLEGIPDTIRGQAETMNHVFAEGGGQLGCRFLSFEDDGEKRLHEWLTTHVIATATVRISEQEAAEIVRGPSLI